MSRTGRVVRWGPCGWCWILLYERAEYTVLGGSQRSHGEQRESSSHDGTADDHDDDCKREYQLNGRRLALLVTELFGRLEALLDRSSSRSDRTGDPHEYFEYLTEINGPRGNGNQRVEQNSRRRNDQKRNRRLTDQPYCQSEIRERRRTDRKRHDPDDCPAEYRCCPDSSQTCPLERLIPQSTRSICLQDR